MLRENMREIGDDGESRKRVADFTATILHVETSNERTQSANRAEYHRTEFLIKSLRDTSNASDAEILENVGEILLRFVAEVSWQMNRVHVAANVQCAEPYREMHRVGQFL